MCTVASAASAATVERFNTFAESGVDEDFGRGADEYDTFFAGGSGPNTALVPITDLLRRLPRTGIDGLDSALDAISLPPDVVSAILHGILVGPGRGGGEADGAGRLAAAEPGCVNARH